MAKRFIDADKLKGSMLAYYDCLNESANGRPYKGDTLMDYEVVDMIEDCIENAPTADVVEVDDISEKIIRKKAEVSEYWKKDVKQYRAMQGYCDIEHDTDNFLRGYNEAVKDMLAILDGARMEGVEDD